MKNFTLCFLLGMATISCFAAPSISNFTPLIAGIGTTVTINGSGFTGVTGVSFGGTAATSFNVVSATQITAVIAAGSSGSVVVSTSGGNATATGFIFSPVSDIYTDFGGYWTSSTTLPNTNQPNKSYNLLAFKYYGITYATGANNGVLDANGVTYSSSNYKALPVAGIAGSTSSGGGSTYIALAANVDGSAAVANPTTVSSYSIKTVLTDGLNGLNLGTGVTNLPTSAILNFKIISIDPTKINDAEPDILITQIAQPVTGNDVFSFIDVNGNVVGTSLNHDMTTDATFGLYTLDLFNLEPSTPYNYANVYSAFTASTTRDIRLVALRLSDFGITSSNASQVKALQITPSGNSDYAFIAYNANAINMPPNITINTSGTSSTICSGGTATLSVIGAPSGGGSLSYTWQRSTDAGNTWNTVTDGSGFSGSATSTLTVANAVNNDLYRATVAEAGNSNTATSSNFTIVVSAPAAPSSVTLSSSASICLNTPTVITSTVTGGSNLYYQWQVNSGSGYTNIPGANLATYAPPVNATGSNTYNVLVTSGSGCGGAVSASSAPTITVTGIASTTPAGACGSSALTLNATATSGTVSWYASDAGGSALTTGNTYTTPTLSGSTTYYVASSGCPSALRIPVIATIDPATVGGSISHDTTVTTHNNTATLSLTGNTGSVVKWQSSTDNFNSSIADISNTASNYTAVNLTQTTAFRAVVQSGTCSLANSVQATVTVAIPLPLANISVKAFAQNNSIEVEWTVTDEHNMKQYEVEKMSGANFIGLYTIAAAGNAEQAVYNWSDTHAGAGDNVYRIKSIDYDGNIQYSAMVKVTNGAAQTGIAIYPNPLTTGDVNLQLNNMVAGNYQVILYNSTGRLVAKTLIVHSGGSAAVPVHFGNSLSNGVYEVHVLGPAHAGKILRLVKMPAL